MRLLHTTTCELHEFVDPIPQYAILSHTWGEEEVTFNDMSSPTRTSRKGWTKIKSFCETALAEGWEYIWIDTCCINKSDVNELGEAINSMFRWYEEAQICYAYLADVHPLDSRGRKCGRPNYDISESRWFERGWTLQELLAPPFLAFLDSAWNSIGSREDYAPEIWRATNIDPDDMLNFRSCSIATKLAWASGRETTKVEDRAYSLLGLLGVHMPLIYGEGANAFKRLQHELIRLYNDETMLLWTSSRGQNGFCVSLHGDRYMYRKTLLAESPDDYFASRKLIVSQHDNKRRGFSITNAGLNLDVELFQKLPGESSKHLPDNTARQWPPLYAITLNCARAVDRRDPIVLLLESTKTGSPFYNIRKHQPLQTWSQLSGASLSQKNWISLGERRIILTVPDSTQSIRTTPGSTLLLSINIQDSLHVTPLSTQECFGCNPFQNQHQRAIVDRDTIPPSVPGMQALDTGLVRLCGLNKSHFRSIQWHGGLVFNRAGALMVNGTTSISIFKVTAESKSQLIASYKFVILIHSNPPFPRVGVWNIRKNAPSTPEKLLAYLENIVTLGYPTTATLDNDLVVHITAKPKPLPTSDPLELGFQSFAAALAEGRHWLKSSSRLKISKHVGLDITFSNRNGESIHERGA